MQQNQEARAATEEPVARRRISRRGLLATGTAASAAFFAAHATGDYSLIREAIARNALPPPPRGRAYAASHEELNDDPIDPVAVEDGSAGWFPSIYGAGDERGALNEITPLKIGQALRMLNPMTNKNKPLKVYNLGELMQPGIPAFGDRVYEQMVLPPALEPPYTGENELNGMEERITTTYHIATQIDGLPHIGVRSRFYNGFTAEEMVEGNDFGVNHLGQEHMGPFMTRGLLLDVLSLKVAQGDSDALGDPVDGQPILDNSYRITVEDLEGAMAMGNTGPIEPGDVVVIRTGWTHLFDPFDEDKKARYLATEPGIYLREARWFAHFRPAVVASDTWALEVLPAPEPYTETQLYPVHQEFLTHHGIRIGEAFRSEDLVADGVTKFVFFYTPQHARGATAANVAPGAIAQPA